MARSGVPIGELPEHLQRRVRARAGLDGVELGPDSPLLKLKQPDRKRRDPGEEHAEQKKVIEWADAQVTRAQFMELAGLYSIPNESFGRRDGAEKKARGRRKGMLDLCLPVARRAPDGYVYGACYLEMKALTGTVRETQELCIRILRSLGNFVEVALSAETAKAILIYYLSLPRP